jgi:hypothetical protein
LEGLRYLRLGDLATTLIQPEIVDLSQGNFPNLIMTPELEREDQHLMDRLSHINYGLDAAKNGRSEVTIKEFYLAIEGIKEAKEKQRSTKIMPL